MKSLVLRNKNWICRQDKKYNSLKQECISSKVLSERSKSKSMVKFPTSKGTTPLNLLVPKSKICRCLHLNGVDGIFEPVKKLPFRSKYLLARERERESKLVDILNIEEGACGARKQVAICTSYSLQ